MGNEINKKQNLILIISAVIMQILVTAIFIAVFAAVMYALETDYKYSPVFGSISVGAGAFFGAFYLSRRKKSKGYVYGLIIGAVTFCIVTVIGLIINQGTLTVNTLFHFIIIMLSALIGGITGVNKGPQKYI